MFIFSFAGDKGARYICVVLPFAAMAVAYLVVLLIQKTGKTRLGVAALVCVLLMSIFLLKKSVAIAAIDSDYKESAEYLMARDPQVKFLSTQNFVQNLYVPNPDNVKPCPHDFNYLAQY